MSTVVVDISVLVKNKVSQVQTKLQLAIYENNIQQMKTF